MSGTFSQLQNVLPAQGTLSLTPDELQHILEIAYLAIAIDRVINEEELANFQAAYVALHACVDAPASGESSSGGVGQTVRALLDSFAASIEHTDPDERLRTAAAALRRPELRQLAYKVAYALSLCDLASTDEEFEFDLELVDALELTNEEAETLAAEVNATTFRDVRS